jgi:hypothetical protein
MVEYGKNNTNYFIATLQIKYLLLNRKIYQDRKLEQASICQLFLLLKLFMKLILNKNGPNSRIELRLVKEVQ